MGKFSKAFKATFQPGTTSSDLHREQRHAHTARSTPPTSFSGPPSSPASGESYSTSASTVPSTQLVAPLGKPLASHNSFYSRNGVPPSLQSGVSEGRDWTYHELEEDEAPFSNLAGGDTLKVVIVGTGFAGLSAAIACARQGFAVTLIEKGAGVSPHGDNISIGCNAAKILNRWGLMGGLWEHSCKGGWWLIKHEEGECLRVEDLRDFPALFGAPLLQGHRAQMLGVLGVEARLLRARVRLNTEVIAYHDSPKQPSLTTADGEVIFADCIIVADGIHSPGRDMLAKQLAAADRNPALPGARPKKPSGYSVHRGLVKADKVASNPKTAYLLDGNCRTWLGHDAHCLVAPLDNNRQISFSFVHFDFSGTASLNWRDRRPITEVTDLMEGWDDSLVEAIKTFKTCLNWRKTEEKSATQWFTAGGKIMLIGDAVHPLPPSSFQGGSQSVEDGASLAICLALAGGRNEDVPRALEAFQTIRFPRVKHAQEVGVQQRAGWHAYCSSLLPSSLDLLISQAYDHDEELNTINTFERVVQQTFDPTWALPRETKGAVLSRLKVGHQPSLVNIYPRNHKPEN